MPELPEAETIVQQLQKVINGKTILRTQVLDATIVDATVKDLKNRIITRVYRRGKAVVVRLDDGHFLFIRLGMTGHFQYASRADTPRQPYAIAQFSFTDHSRLTFHDIRRFGSLQCLNQHQLEQEEAKLGPEPLEKGFTALKFTSLLRQKNQANIKTTLMDQGVIAGIGNIYAQEALYGARIDPQRKISTLSLPEISLLHQQLQQTLRQAIAHNGTSVLNYVHMEGEGKFQNFLAVYQKEKCPQNHPVTRISLGGRGTFYCGKCQK